VRNLPRWNINDSKPLSLAEPNGSETLRINSRPITPYYLSIKVLLSLLKPLSTMKLVTFLNSRTAVHSNLLRKVGYLPQTTQPLMASKSIRPLIAMLFSSARSVDCFPIQALL
jgi:hypothetical protein